MSLSLTMTHYAYVHYARSFEGEIFITSEPAPCRLIDCLEQSRQKLWLGTDGH